MTLCGAPQPGGMFRCTRRPHHPGDHIATIGPYHEGEPIIAQWPASPTNVPDVTLGATHRFPRGPADDTDEGELTLAAAVDHQQGIIRVVFGKPIAWIGLPSKEARDFAQMLLEKADELDRRQI